MGISAREMERWEIACRESHSNPYSRPTSAQDVADRQKTREQKKKNLKKWRYQRND